MQKFRFQLNNKSCLPCLCSCGQKYNQQVFQQSLRRNNNFQLHLLKRAGAFRFVILPSFTHSLLPLFFPLFLKFLFHSFVLSFDCSFVPLSLLFHQSTHFYFPLSFSLFIHPFLHFTVPSFYILSFLPFFLSYAFFFIRFSLFFSTFLPPLMISILTKSFHFPFVVSFLCSLTTYLSFCFFPSSTISFHRSSLRPFFPSY